MRGEIDEERRKQRKKGTREKTNYIISSTTVDEMIKRGIVLLGDGFGEEMVTWYNQGMTKKETGILIALGIFVIALVVFGITTQNERERILDNFEEGIGNPPISEVPLPPEGSDFISTVPENVIETTPTTEAPASPGSSSKLGGYEIEIRKGGFIPQQIVVKKGDAVQIKITATDGKYDFVIPYLEIGVVVNQGETRQVTLRADSVGTFSFECKDFCPAGGAIRGALVVKE